VPTLEDNNELIRRYTRAVFDEGDVAALDEYLAPDFYNHASGVDTLFLKRFYVLFFIELATRRVHLAGITTNPDGAWVTQQARNLLMQLDDQGVRPRLLVRDRDSKFTREFDEVFRSEGIRVIKALVRATKARAHAERWVGTVRRECLDRLLILGRPPPRIHHQDLHPALQRAPAAPLPRAAPAVH
jgi:transposase InsO family protein